MRNRAIAILFLTAVAAAAQVTLPRIGCIVDSGGRLRPVLGIAGNFLIGEAEAEKVISAACSDGLTIIKREESLEIRTRHARTERPAPAGTALFGLSEDGRQVVVFFSEAGEWLNVSAGSVRAVRDAPVVEGEVIAVGFPEQLVRKEGESATPVLPLPGGGRLTVRAAELLVTTATGEERTIALPGPAAALEWLGRGWVHIRLAEGAGRLALSLERKQVYRLPEAEQ